MEPQTYEIKCPKCDKVIGESSVENHEGFICQTCDDETQLINALAEGKNYDAPNLAAERPERLKEIVKAALFENPDGLLSLNYNEQVEELKTQIQTAIGIDDLEHEQKVEVLQKVREKGEITEISDQELKDKVAAEKEIVVAKIENESKR